MEGIKIARALYLSVLFSLSACTSGDDHIEPNQDAQLSQDIDPPKGSGGGLFTLPIIEIPVTDEGVITRVSPEVFASVHPEFAHVNFSSIGKLTLNDEFICSAVLLEPGNLVVTSRHCINASVSAEYHFITTDNTGGEYKVFLPGHGDKAFQDIHIPTFNYFLKSDFAIKDPLLYTPDFNFLMRAVSDIAFFTLDTPVDLELVTPARIANEEFLLDEYFSNAFVSGYSSFNGERPNNELSITNIPCNSQSFQTYEGGSLPKEVIISDCSISYGDSGGAHFIIAADGVPEVIGINSRFLLGNEGYLDSFYRNSATDLSISGYNVGHISVATPLSGLGPFCQKHIGEEFCAAFADVGRGEVSLEPSGSVVKSPAPVTHPTPQR